LRRVVAPGLALYCLIAGWGPFIGPGLAGAWFFPWVAGYLLLLLLVAYETYITPHASLPAGHVPFRFVLLGIILLNFAIQVNGGLHAALWPFYFLFAVIVSAFLSPRRAYAMAAVILAIESANLLFTRKDLSGQPQLYAGFGLTLVAVSAAASHIMHRARRETVQVRDAHERLIAHADAVDPLAAPARLEELTRERRKIANVSAAREREDRFQGLINMIFSFVPAHTYALLLKERRDGSDVLILRALRTESAEAALPLGAVLDPGKKLLVHHCLEQGRVQNIPDVAAIGMPMTNFGYYRDAARDPGIASLLVLPIMHGDRTAGALAVDSLERGAFSPENEDMLRNFAPFFTQIIEKIQMAQDLEAKAVHFGALHDISTDLNSSLKFGEIMNAALPRIRGVVPFDFCACVLATGPEGRSVLTFAALYGYDASFLGASFPLEESAILVHMRKHWRDQGYLKYYTADFTGRGRDIGLFPFKELQRPIRSMYGRLLVAQDTLLGAFFIASLRPDAFTEYHRNFLFDTLMNQLSQAACNSLLYQRIEDMARTDGLTGLLNHRTFMEKLAEKYRELERTPRPFSILLMDIDKFKGVNDKYGHPVGDLAIKAVARVLAETVRGTDFAARYGGEEFAVGMIETDRKGAEQMAERVRSIMEQTVVTRLPDGELKVTLSIGVVSYPEDTGDRLGLVTLADEALYHAKRTGRNRVCLYRDAVGRSRPAASS
jgi:diguanylate cyclase (GGDEF)-like protein